MSSSDEDKDVPDASDDVVDGNSDDSDVESDSDPWLDQIGNSCATVTVVEPVLELEEFVEQYLFRIIQLLNPKETPKIAMDRYLGLKKSVPVFKSTIKRKKVSHDEATPGVVDKDSFDRLVESVDRLVGKGWPEILMETREDILKNKCGRIFLEYLLPDKSVSAPISMNILLEKGDILFRHVNKSDQPWRQFH